LKEENMPFLFFAVEGPEDPTRFLPLMVVLGLAFVVPFILARFPRLPVVIGEIVFGVLVGPFVLGWVREDVILTFMSDIGLAFLMFLAGMEINFDLLFSSQKSRKDGPNLVLISLVIYGLTVVLAFSGAFLLDSLGIQGDVWLLAFVLSATSLGVLLPILKERGLLETRYGQILFLSAMLADFITVILLTVYLITLDKGFDPEIFTLTLLFVLFLMLFRLGPRMLRVQRVSNLIERLSSATVQIKVRGAIAILMAFVVLAEFVDAELILGAFLAGMIISLLKRPEDSGLVHNLEAFGFGFFVPVFFIMVGVNLDINSLLSSPQSLISLPLILGISILIKVLPMAAVVRYFGWKDALVGGFFLNTHLSLEIAVAVIGVRSELLSQATGTVLIVFSLLTVLLMPLLFNIFGPKAPEKEMPYMLILGASDLGVHVAQQLRAFGDKVRFIACDAQERRLLSEVGFEYDEMEQLDDLKASSVRAALVLQDEDARNLELGRKVRQTGIRAVISIVRDATRLPDFEAQGIRTYSPAMQRPTMISMMARNPDALDLLTTASESRTIVEIEVTRSGIVGKAIRDLKLPGDLLVLTIRREGSLIIPRGGTTLGMGDRVTVLGSYEDLNDVRTLMGG
jgi:Kef-type K+ transport system membrane component KefB/Trk K+ transport system NAD-binding subunit